MLAEAEHLRSTAVQSWHSELVNSVVSENPCQDIESERNHFHKALCSIDLYQKKDSEIASTINKLLASCKKPEHQIIFHSFSRKIENLFIEPSNVLEDYFRKTCLQHFVDSEQTEVFNDLKVRALRSVRPSTNYTYNRD